MQGHFHRARVAAKVEATAKISGEGVGEGCYLTRKKRL